MKRALITGGSGAIGAAICRRLASDGMHVIVHANRNADAAENLVSELRAAGQAAQAVSFDVGDQEQTKCALEALLEEGAIQVVVNNAGMHDDALMVGMDGAQWQVGLAWQAEREAMVKRVYAVLARDTSTAQPFSTERRF